MNRVQNCVFVVEAQDFFFPFVTYHIILSLLHLKIPFCLVFSPPPLSSMFNPSSFWLISGIVSCFFTVFCFFQSHFFENQFKNSNPWLAYFFVAIPIFIACAFLFRPQKTQETNEYLTKYWPAWLVKAFFEFCILLFVTLMAMLSKYPRFKVFHKQDGNISDMRAYCHKSNYPDPDIKAICSSLLKDQNTEQGDFMGFYSAVGFSVFTFSVSRQLELPNVYGLFYMTLDLIMNVALDIPVSGGSILHWKFVLISILYCFGSILLWGFLHSSVTKDGNHDDQQSKETVLGISVGNDMPPLQRDDHHCVIDMNEQSGIGDEHQAEVRSDDNDDEEERRRSIEEEERALVKRARRRRSIEAKERRRSIEEERSIEAKERRRIIEEERILEVEEGLVGRGKPISLMKRRPSAR